MHVLLFAYWLLRLKKSIYISAIILIITYFNSPPIYLTKAKTKALAKDNSFSLLTYNCQQFYSQGGSKESVQKVGNKIAHFINQEFADIVCLQEARHSIEPLLNYPYKSKVGFNHFYSKYKILNTQELKFEHNSSNKSAFADILVHKDTVRVYNLHLESIHLGFNDLQLIDNWEEENKQDQIKKNTERLSNKISAASKKRVNQLEVVMASIEASPYASVICGDFNDVPSSYVYRKLRTHHKDAFIESGKGYGATYRKLYFPLRIDYILNPNAWSAYNFEVLDQKFSDHQAIRCDLEMN